MKRTVKIITFALAAGVVLGAAAMASADEVKYYDVAAYISYHPIPCYSINDYCGVYVSDLRNYGFIVDYDEASRTVNITRDDQQWEIPGIEGVTLPAEDSGTVYGYTEPTLNKVILDGKVEARSYCVDGRMMMLLDDMYPFGDVSWDDEKHALFVKIFSMAEAEYQPLTKPKKEYSRYKPGVYELDHDWYYNFSTENVNWGFKRVAGNEPELESWRKSMLAKFDAYYMDPSKPHKIYLTFDEGYENGYTPQILDVLSKYNVPATFFVTGQFLDESGYLVDEMISRGFSVGNHTVNHPNLAKLSIDGVMSELDEVSNRLRDEHGYKCVYMRPPEGAISERVLAIAKDLGYNTILWSFAYDDWEPSNQRGADYAYNLATTYMHDGAIYLLHAVSKDNANALESIIQYAMDNGYEFGSLDELCNP